MKIFNKKWIALLMLMSVASCKPNHSSAVVIGIIEPMEHAAMNEIVKGFSDTLYKLYKKSVVVKVENAQNDANLQRAMIQKMHDANYKIIVPIGVDATQMSLAMTQEQAIVSLASDLSEADRKKLRHCNVSAVHDEISLDKAFAFIHAVYPYLTRLTLIHSAADKVFPEVKEAIEAGKKYGISVEHKMVASLPELYSIARALSPQTQAIFVLKDSLIVSGIGTLSKAAKDRHIPLITSDQGSVEEGASFSLGVYEKEIGVEGAKLAVALLQGTPLCSLPLVEMTKLTVFINSGALKRAGQEVTPVIQGAKKFNYNIAMTS